MRVLGHHARVLSLRTDVLTCTRRHLSRASASAVNAVGRLEFDATKAGLQKVDKAYVEKVIQDSTHGSAFYQSEQRKEAMRSLKIDALVSRKHHFSRLSGKEKRVYAVRATAVEEELEKTRKFTRCFIHVDIDMFYAAVEEKLDPTLREQPFAVGSYAMLATSNYVARTYGVRSGMPGFIAKKLCPALRIRPLRFDLYRQEAAVVRSIGADYDPHYVTVGLDELTMDVTEYLRRHPNRTAEDVCAEFRRRVEERTQLTCSGGIAHTAAFAKLASNVNKPNGQHFLKLHTRDEVLAYIRDIPVRQMPGVGFATERQLRALGIATCKDFLKHKAELCYLFREKTFMFYLSIGLGLVRTHVDRYNAERETASSSMGVPATKISTSNSRVPVSIALSVSDRPAPDTAVACPVVRWQKSTGKCLTVMHGIRSRDMFWKHLRHLTKSAHAVLLKQNTATKHLCFHTTDRAFLSRSHSTTLPDLTNTFSVIYATLAKIAKPFAEQHREFRLIGVRFGKLQPPPANKGLARATDVRQRRAQRHVDARRAPPPSLKIARRHVARQSTARCGDAHYRTRTKVARQKGKGSLK